MCVMQKQTNKQTLQKMQYVRILVKDACQAHVNIEKQRNSSTVECENVFYVKGNLV